MLQYSIPVLAMCLIDVIVFLYLLRTVHKRLASREPEKKRRQSVVRRKFKTVQDVAKFYAWREHIRTSLIEIEKQKILNDDKDQKVYYSI